MKFYQLSFYVPVTHCEEVKNAIFATGAGSQGNYSNCSWQCLGEGQFMPSVNAKPFLGSADKLEKVQEYKVEILCDSTNLKSSVKAMKQAHPYEEVAFNIIELTNLLN